ncbi:MAG TPA: type 4a pilus biogenesis protein PilO [Acidimicrobiales bacterium]|nr:type 4a pilus biogenesis protein PilO [Acidimicrobiales bacterium]
MKTKLILIGVLSSAVIAGLWFFFLWSPQGDKLDKARADEVAAEQRASELQTRLTHLKKLEANAEVLQADREKLSTAIPDVDKLDEFILQVNERAARAGVSFVSVAPAQPGAGAAAPGAVAGGPTAIGLQISVTGNYFAILRFMEEIRDGGRLVTVENFSLSGEGNEMNAAIGGRMFLFNPATAAAPAATAAPTAGA